MEPTVVITEIAPGLRLLLDLSDVTIGLNIARRCYEQSELRARSCSGRGRSDRLLEVSVHVEHDVNGAASLVVLDRDLAGAETEERVVGKDAPAPIVDDARER